MKNVSGEPGRWFNEHDDVKVKQVAAPVERGEPADLSAATALTAKALEEARKAYDVFATRDLYDTIMQLEGALESLKN